MFRSWVNKIQIFSHGFPERKNANSKDSIQSPSSDFRKEHVDKQKIQKVYNVTEIRKNYSPLVIFWEDKE